MQFGVFLLLVVCALLVGYWMMETVIHTDEVQQRLAALAPGDAAALQRINDESDRRINRFLWEGAFFLVVLFIGAGVLLRAIRHDAELHRRQQNFLAAVSHEFKSPLASIRLAAETLVLRSNDADTRRLGQRILEDGERLLRMVDNLLETTRIEEGRQQLARANTPIRDVVDGVVGELAERARLSNVVIAVDVPAEFTVSVDPVALETILRNLLDNALKACAAGGGSRVRVQATRTAGGIELAVKDDGSGFSPVEAAMIFEKFYRLGDEQRRTTPGTGLGLYIVRRLVELSDARIEAHSDGPGTGATFTILWQSE